jgi:hypothetical protein
LLDLLRCNGKDIQYLNYGLHKYLRQFGVNKTSRINLEALEEVLYAHEDVREYIVARVHILCRLPSPGIKTCTQRNGEDTDGK